jgi:hypothetical protein
MVTFFQLAHFSLDNDTHISMRWLASLNGGHSPFPHNFPRSHLYLIHYQSKDFRAREMVT